VAGREQLERAFVRVLGALPPPVERIVAGSPVEVDGQRLEPSVQIALRLLEHTGPSLDELSVEAARAQIRHNSEVFAGRRVPMARVEDLAIPSPAAAIPARLYTPPGAAQVGPLYLYFHGGGWVTGDLDTHDSTCRFLADRAGVKLLAVDYRLGPEHPFPAAVEDAVAAFHFAAAESERLGVNPAAIAVGGDSAGGNLAAVVSQLTRRDRGPAPVFQLLIYPVCDLSTKRDSYRLFSEGFGLAEAEMDWYRGHYLPDESAARDPRASPLLADDLTGLPPAYIATAGFDPLRDEGEEYAARLRAAGVPVALRRHRGLVHAFMSAVQVSPKAREAGLEAVGALRMGFSSAG
jgi:acetyl esterase